VGGSEARKPRSLKSGALKPSSLIEVYAYDVVLYLYSVITVYSVYGEINTTMMMLGERDVQQLHAV